MIILTCWKGPVNGLGVPPIDVLSPVTAGNLPLKYTDSFVLGDCSKIFLFPTIQGRGIKGLILVGLSTGSKLLVKS